LPNINIACILVKTKFMNKILFLFFALIITSITKAQVPVANFSVSGPSCAGSVLQLIDLSTNSPTAWSYTMSGGSPTISSVQNPTVTYSIWGTYSISLVAINANGPSSVVTKTIAIGSSTTTAANTGPYCPGSIIQLYSSAVTPSFSSYNWAGPLGFTSNVQNPSITGANSGMSGVYAVTITVGTCTTSASTSVTILASPILSASSSSSLICAGQTATLSTSGTSTSYTWSTGATTSSISVSPTVTTTYTVTAAITDTFSSTSCYTTTTITQSVSPCTGIENNEGVTYYSSVFPNPSNGNITVTLEKITDNTFIEIYNAIGELVYQRKVDAKENLINENFPSGIYLLKVMDGNSILVRKKIVMSEK
jgi:hypothetical protein